MAGYSGTPLPRKLGIKPDSRVAVVSARGAVRRAWPKRAPGVATNLTEDAVRDVARHRTSRSDFHSRQSGTFGGRCRRAS